MREYLKKYRPLLEVFSFFLLLVVFNWAFFPQRPGFLDVDPHPFWFAILLFGFRYGVVTGLTSGVLSTLFYLTAAWLSGEQYRFEELNFYLLPSFFIFVGVFVGVVTAKGRQEIEKLKREKEGFKTEIQKAKGELETLGEVNRGLEKKIVTRMTTVVTLYQGARSLESVEEEELYPSILSFTAKALEATEMAIHRREEKGWKLAHHYGWKESHRRPTFSKPNEGIIGLAGDGNKIISIRDFMDPRRSFEIPEYLGDALVAGPLRVGEKGEVVAVLSVQNIPFLLFNSATVNLFNFLLQWASASLERARYVKSLKGQEILDPEFNIYSAKYFQNRLCQEFARSKTYYLPLSLGIVQIPELPILSHEKRRWVLYLLAQLLQKSCREMDVIASFEEKSIPFAILWVTANEKQALEMKKAILDHFHQLDLENELGKISLNISIASFSPKLEDANAFLTMAKKGLEHLSDEKKLH